MIGRRQLRLAVGKQNANRRHTGRWADRDLDRGAPAAPWVLFEREARLGGLAVTRERDGYSLRQDRALAAPARSGRQEAGRRAAARTDGPDRAQGPHLLPRRATRYPYQANLLRAAARGDQGVPARRRRGQAGDTRRRAEPPPANFEDYCLRHFGAGISKHFMIPYNETMWGVSPAGDHRRLVLALRAAAQPGAGGRRRGRRRAGPRWATTRASSIRSRAASRPSRARCGPRDGRRRVHTRASLDAVDWQRREVDGRRRARALPPRWSRPCRCPSCSSACPGCRPRSRPSAARLRCTTLRYLELGDARRSRPPTGTGSTCPRSAIPFYRVNVFSTAMPPSMAPPGAARSTSRWPTAGRSPTRPCATSAAALAGCGRDPLARRRRVRRAEQIEYAYVVFDQHYYEATRVIFAFLESHAIYPRGRYGAWTYNAMEDCAASPGARWRGRSMRRRSRQEEQRMNQAGAPPPTFPSSSPSTTRRGSCAARCWSCARSCGRFGFSYELLLCENGSRDRTVEIGKELEAEYPEVRLLSVGRAELRPGHEAPASSRRAAAS